MHILAINMCVRVSAHSQEIGKQCTPRMQPQRLYGAVTGRAAVAAVYDRPTDAIEPFGRMFRNALHLQ